ncbi:MAG: transporter [Burkholderiales bacterium]|nr:transporter [Burkholderiales bacterium]
MKPLKLATPILFATLSLFAASARAELSAEELAKLAQNPVGNLISVPFQNNTNFNVGPLNGTQNILNIQPVIPVTVNKDWNIITRTILPLVWQPEMVPGQGSTFGLSDLQFTAFLSPSDPGPGGLIWGAGAIVQAPTDTQDLGNKNWGLGPSLVVLKLEKGDPWVYGFLVNNVWSLSSDKRGGSYSNFLIQPFVNYNFPDFYVNSVPIITANWKADSGQQWTVPLGLGVGKIFHLGKLPVNTQFGAYYNVVKPDYGANWQLRLQVQFMFPK